MIYEDCLSAPTLTLMTLIDAGSVAQCGTLASRPM